MAHIHIVDSGTTDNNGVMAMTLGFMAGLSAVCGSHDVTVVLTSSGAFEKSEARLHKYHVSTVRSGLARWRGGYGLWGKLSSLAVPLTGRLWTLGQRWNFRCLTLEDWRPADADVVVSLCGEDYFSDNWSLRLCHSRHIQDSYVERLGIPRVVMAQTFGPFRRDSSRRLAYRHLSRAALVTARDDASYQTLKNDLKLNGNIHRTGDLAFLMIPENWELVTAFHEELRSALLEEGVWIGISVSQLFATHSFQSSTASTVDRIDTFYSQIASSLDAILQRHANLKLVFVPQVTTPYTDDRLASRDVVGRMRYAKRTVVLADEYSAPELKAVIGKCAGFIGCRMHALVGAISQGVPALCLAYSPKTIDVIGKDLNYPFVVDFRNLEPSSVPVTVAGAFAKMWQARQATIERTDAQVNKVRNLARYNFVLLRSLLGTEDYCALPDR